MSEDPIDKDKARAALSASVTAYALGRRREDILNGRRGSPETAFARQVSMYLSHAAFGLSLARVAAAFGRDRSTVAYACHQIEDRRDDPRFDAWLERLEDVLTTMSDVDAAPVAGRAA